MNKSEKTTAHTSATEFFPSRYPPFADTFEIQQPFKSQAETVVLHRALALIRQAKSLAIYGEAGAGKSMLLKSMTHELDTKSLPHRHHPLRRDQAFRHSTRTLRSFRYRSRRKKKPAPKAPEKLPAALRQTVPGPHRG